MKLRAADLQPKGLDEGIYFGLDEDIYHTDPALSYSGMKKLHKSLAFYWFTSPLNIEADRRTVYESDSDALKVGRAMHTYLLEGPEKFKEKYFVSPGEPWDLPRREMVANYEFKKMQEQRRLVMGDDEIKEMFTGGKAEISIFWRDPETGIMLRCRVDYMRILSTTICATDYKSCRDASSWSCGRDVVKFGYDIQNAIYSEGIHRIRELLQERKVKVYGDDIDEEFVKRLIYSDGLMFYFCFQEKKPPFMVNAFDLPINNIKLGAIWGREAITKYVEAMEKFGPGRPWTGGETKVGTLPEQNIPLSHY